MNNSKIISVDKANSVRAEAASWIAQLDSDNFTDADRLALMEWAARSPYHLEELKRLGAMWLDIDEVLSVPAKQELVEKPTLKQLLISALKVRPRPVYGAAAGAFLSLALLVSAIFIATPLMTPSPFEETYTVSEGSQRLIPLPDGSKVHLNTNSLVQVEITNHKRLVRLIRGEAHFDVAHDKKKPFLVEANGSLIRAVGTAFVVRINPTETSVIVTEGVVELKSAIATVDEGKNQPTKDRAARLLAGQSASVIRNEPSAKPKITQVPTRTIERKLAWREGLVIFDGEPLTYVVDEISRYTPSRIVISDPLIRDLPIGGSFKAGEVDALLRALQASFGVTVQRVDSDLIYLSRAETG